MSKHVIRVHFGNAGNFDRLIVALQILQGTRQPVHGLGKGGICSQRLPIGGNGLFQLPIRHQIERGIVVVFSCLAGVCIGHEEKSLAELGF